MKVPQRNLKLLKDIAQPMIHPHLPRATFYPDRVVVKRKEGLLLGLQDSATIYAAGMALSENGLNAAVLSHTSRIVREAYEDAYRQALIDLGLL